MKKIYEQGITLIALVVTIIILMILAGVTVGIAINGDGLFKKANEATKMYINAQDQEETLLAEYENTIEYYTRENSNIMNYSLNKEKIVGQWIDNKPIYQITKSYTNIEGTDTSNRREFSLENGEYINDIDTLIGAEGIITSLDDILFFSSSMSPGQLMYNASYASKKEVYITFSKTIVNCPSTVDVIMTYRYTKK